VTAIALRIGVVICVGAACLLGAGRLDNAIAVFDFQADANYEATHIERTYPQIEWLPDGGRVMEDARLWMPAGAAYRVRHGPAAKAAKSLEDFLFVLLRPRRQTTSPSAPWVFCNGCTRPLLGPEYEVLSDSGRGFLFARKRP
jgi:hypothetical protein